MPNSLPLQRPHLTWRPLVRPDLDALSTLALACFQVDGGLHFQFEPPNLSEQFFPEAANTAVGAFLSTGQMAASAVRYWAPGSTGQKVVCVGLVHPDWRQQGLGTQIMQWYQEQAAAFGTDVDPAPRLLQINTEALTEGARRLYAAWNFQLTSEALVMRRELADPSPNAHLPPGVTLTLWEPNRADQFFQAYHAAFQERPGFPGWRTPAEWVDSWMNEAFQPEWSLLAQLNDQPVGFLLGTSNPPHGFVMQVGVIPSLRRAGLASALITEVMQRMRDQRAVSVQLTVHLNNPGAIAAYERLGFVTIGRRASFQQTAPPSTAPNNLNSVPENIPA